MNVTLRITHSEEEQRPAAAWFIPGGHAAAWLEELGQWGVPLAGIRLLCIPRAPADLSPGGVLVVPPAGTSPLATGRARPYGRVAGRLYLPVEARIEPPATDAELTALLDTEQTYVWHPAIGLAAFEARQILAIADLLVPPQRRDASWDRASPGVACGGRLLSIEPAVRLDLAAMIREAGGDIGSQPPTLDELPPSPNEPSPNPARQLGRSFTKGVAHAVNWLANQAPGGASERTWINDVQDWARRQLRQAGESLEAARHRELIRLMDLLANDPDRGLRYALPMGGDAHRGVGKPGARLSTHDVNFNINRLGGGGPADFWDVPQDYRVRLLNRYRELANREIALGRHRRAAYILAELLGDVRSAAATLATGGHFREAAALYEERLKEPLAAAQCLERGGLWTEAIALFQRLGHHERVGDLFRQLEQPEQAEAAYRQAVQDRLTQGDALAAAGLLEKKLDVPQEALETLFDGWRTSQQRARCLEEAFRLLARMADHAQARRQVAGLLEAPSAADHLLLTQGLAEVAQGYPDTDVRHAAADGARTVASTALDLVPALREAQALTTAVARLAPQDRLLDRDCREFAARQAPPLKPAALPRRPAAGCPLVREFKLPPARWKAAGSMGDCYFAAGFRGNDWRIVAGNWEGRQCDVDGRRSGQAIALEWPFILLTGHPDGRPTVVLCPVEEPIEDQRTLPQMPWLPHNTTVGRHPGVSPQTLALQYGSQGVLYLVEQTEADSLVLKSYGLTGTLLGSQRLELPKGFLSDEEQGDLMPPLPFHVRGTECYLALGQTVYTVTRDGLAPLFDTGYLRIRSLTASPPHTRARIIAGCERGGMIVWGETALDLKPFAMQLDAPVIGLTRGGWLVAAGREETMLYDTHNSRRFAVAATIPTGGPNNKALPVAVLSTRNTDQFALLLEDGRLLIHQAPERL